MEGRAEIKLSLIVKFDFGKAIEESLIFLEAMREFSHSVAAQQEAGHCTTTFKKKFEIENIVRIKFERKF